MFCQYCGKEVEQGSTSCSGCGAQLNNPMYNTAQNAAPIPPQQPTPYPPQGMPNQMSPHQGYYPQGCYQKPPVDPDAPANVGFIILSVFFPIIGIILGAVKFSDGAKREGKAYLIAALVTIGVSVVLTILCFSMFFSPLFARYWAM